MTQYICFEGTEGVGKTTQTRKLVEHLRDLGYTVLETKEPGTPLSPLTMELRNLMLNNKFDKEMTTAARELISQAIRSVHMERVVEPAIGDVDFIVQDRGVLSGFAYGTACGNDLEWLEDLSKQTTNKNPYIVYDNIIRLTGDVRKGLETAKNAKQEFEEGDAIEAKGNEFMETVNSNMERMSQTFNGVQSINVDGKDIETVFSEILSTLNLPDRDSNG